MPIKKKAVKIAKPKPAGRPRAGQDKPEGPKSKLLITKAIGRKILQVFRGKEIKAPLPSEEAEASKYYVGPVVQKLAQEKPFELPAGYGDNRIVAMVRDTHWLYAYWEISGRRRQEIENELGGKIFSLSKEYLRVYDTESWESFDIEVTGGARNWYLRAPTPSKTYCIDIGYLSPDGKFVTAARSNWVTTPLDRMSDVIDEQWMIPDWEKMYALSGGFGIGRGSEEIRELMKKRFQEESASGWIFSLSSPGHRAEGKERPFWLVATCELIVYGATEPTATVTVQGRKVGLREDGTFSLRFLLPDGTQFIPIEAIRDDGAERRKIIPIVERKTE
ncbi:DUF4912 domain-containing protein [Candidatus Saganbacteria bacterium]|uniref:DUF4912 domain-containing protein n=1 Tax=Candidatus Saganbacteria bacterium TaxID=2575572 RepID=A0A9D6UME0_UNCSA|nr:DUF4912 domain-containing protein [Candidatus Saganbacteria bacterium]